MLFTNHHKDTIRSAFYSYTAKPCEVLLACPFYSNETLIKEIQSQKCATRLIVRLCSATTPNALREAMKAGARIRFFTSRRFHSKLYIFGDSAALVGSANLTDTGMQSNQEIAVGILPDDVRFEELVRIFQSYWNEAKPLDEQGLKSYSTLFQGHKPQADPLDDLIRSTMSDVAPTGIQVGGPKKTKEAIYLDGYRRTYQEFLHAFQIVERLYKEDGRRKQPEDVVPLRLEIDQFFSYVRKEFTSGDSYAEADKLSGPALEDNVSSKIQSWHNVPWKYLDETIPTNYGLITRVFASEDTIKSADFNELVNALMICHAFHEQLRFFKGGIPGVRKAFMTDNSHVQVQDSLCHLLFGPDDFITRMGQSIFDPSYSLRHFSRACVQELCGWINNDVPICNGRTVKSLRFLGFDVMVF